jgi:hypothetical protein
MAGRALRLTLPIAIAALVLASVACSDDDTPDTEDVSTAVSKAGGAESEFCSDLDGLETAVSEVKGLTATSTVDDARDAADNVGDAINDVKDSADDTATAKVDAVKTSFESLKGTLDDLPEEDSIGAAIVVLIQQVTRLADAWTGLQSEAGCP